MRVGVIIPVRAPAPWLEQALAGVLGQDPRPDRVVVVDDGSDRPLAPPGDTAAHCQLVRRERAGGPGPARASGLEALDTELVALADADDVWRPGKLRAQLEALERHPQAAACVGVPRVVGPDARPTGEPWPRLRPGLHQAAALIAEVYERNPIVTSTVLARADAVRAAGGFESPVPPPADDLDLWLRLLAGGAAFVCEPAAEVDYRRHAGGVSADLAALAQSLLAVHTRHASLVDPATARRVRAGDLVALARGRIRQRRYADARRALREAAALEPLSARDRALAALAAVPGLRAGLGRRDPYRPLQCRRPT